jgi:hypothetical protein
MKDSDSRVRRLVLMALTLWACVIWLRNSDIAVAATGETATTEQQNQ